MHTVAGAARARIGAIAQEGRNAWDDFLAARANLETQRRQPERNPERELELAERVRTAETLADATPFRERSNEAAAAAERAVQHYRAYVYQNSPALLAELEQPAIDATEALAAASAKLEPLRVARADAAANVQNLTDTLHNGNHAAAWALPGDPAEVPYPRADVIAWLANEIAPAPVEPDPVAAIVDDSRTWR